jgi:hypothetical protein
MSVPAFLSGYAGWLAIALVVNHHAVDLRNRDWASVLPDLVLAPIAVHAAVTLCGYLGGAVASFLLSAYGNLLSVAPLLAFGLTLGLYINIVRIRAMYDAVEEKYTATVGEGIAEGLRELHGVAATDDADDAENRASALPPRDTETSTDSGSDDEDDEDLLNEAMMEEAPVAAGMIPITPPPTDNAEDAEDGVGPWEIPHASSPIHMEVDAPLSLSPSPVPSDSPVHNIM